MADQTDKSIILGGLAEGTTTLTVESDTDGGPRTTTVDVRVANLASVELDIDCGQFGYESLIADIVKAGRPVPVMEKTSTGVTVSYADKGGVPLGTLGLTPISSSDESLLWLGNVDSPALYDPTRGSWTLETAEISGAPAEGSFSSTYDATFQPKFSVYAAESLDGLKTFALIHPAENESGDSEMKEVTGSTITLDRISSPTWPYLLELISLATLNGEVTCHSQADIYEIKTPEICGIDTSSGEVTSLSNDILGNDGLRVRIIMKKKGECIFEARASKPMGGAGATDSIKIVVE